MDRCDCRMPVQICRPLQHPKYRPGRVHKNMQKNTIQQLQNVMNIMSDAKLSQQDLYLLYVGFSSAFNT